MLFLPLSYHLQNFSTILFCYFPSVPVYIFLLDFFLHFSVLFLFILLLEFPLFSFAFFVGSSSVLYFSVITITNILSLNAYYFYCSTESVRIPISLVDLTKSWSLSLNT